MADKKISELVDGGNIISGDYTIITRNNQNYKVDLNTLIDTTIDWSGITNTPTTLSGYGITDSYTINEVNTLISGATYHPLISLTYSELFDLYTNSLLIPGQKYMITDYRTIHNYLDGNTITGDLNLDGVIEPLILLATSINTFDKQAYSELFPKDIIYYDITGGDTKDIAFFSIGDEPAPISGLTGIIYYRKDTVQNVECWYDFRNVKFRRWIMNYPSWVSGTSYINGNIVNFEETYYVCVKHTSSNISPDLDTINWAYNETLQDLYGIYWGYNRFKLLFRYTYCWII